MSSTVIYPASIKIRWFTANCWEICLSSGETIIIDPFLPDVLHPIEKWRRYSKGFSVEDIEKVDYSFIGHPHGDHLGSLKDVFDKFGCKVMAHSSWAFFLARDLLIPHQMIIPYDNGSHYEFDSFSIDTFIARHAPGDIKTRPNELKRNDVGTEYEFLNDYGPLFNTNCIITDRNNIKICFCAGVHEDLEKNYLKHSGINVILCQCGTMEDNPQKNKPGVFEQSVNNAVDVLINSNAEIMLPTHHEEYSQKESEAFADRVNAILADKGYHGKMFSPIPGQWYTVGISLSAV